MMKRTIQNYGFQPVRNFTHDEFYDILNDEYQNYKITHAIESQRYDYPTSDKGHHSFVSVGSNGVNFGVMT